MKNLYPLFVVCIFAACSSPAKSPEDVAIIEEVKADIEALEDSDAANPIEAFIVSGKEAATELASLDKSNIEEQLSKLSSFETVFITVGNHTLVHITDPKDCSPSGSWGTCMPKGKGYIKKGELELKEDHINNIIGLPDDQERWIYFFDAK